MNILFLTMGKFDSIESHSLYADLMRCFRNHGHEIYAITPYEKRTGKKTELLYERNTKVLHLETGDVTGKINVLKKGLAQMSMEQTYIRAVIQYFPDVKFDLVMYSTPPITFGKVVEFVKQRDGAKSYLLLKDIFPQNAVDLGMMTTNGVKGIIYKYFRSKEKKLYTLSDYIGCMSQANVDYVLKYNPEIAPGRVEICPNAIEIMDQSVNEKTRKIIRKKYGIPQDKTIFIYGGNLGKPQGIPFVIECLKKAQIVTEAFFLIVGSGSDYGKLEKYVSEEKPCNVKLLRFIPKEDYDAMVGACDIGLIFLDHRFTIPNFPSRLLAYMQAKIPVLACTDPNTDIGEAIETGGFGWWCESDDAKGFVTKVKEIIGSPLTPYKERTWKYLTENFNVEDIYRTINGRIG